MAKTCYATVLAEKLHHYRSEDILCDAVIETRDAPVMAHSLILAAASDQLRIAFLAAEKGCRYQLRLDNYTSVDVLSALRYIYTGTLMDEDCQDQFESFDRTVALLGELGVLTGRTLAFDDNIFTGISREANTVLSLISREDESVCCSKDELSLLGLCSESEQTSNATLPHVDDKRVEIVGSSTVQAVPETPASASVDICLASVVQWNQTVHACKKKQNIEVPWYVCAYCELRFKAPSELIEHVTLHSDTLLPEIYRCQVCGKPFSTRRALSQHLSLHVDPKSHECASCGKSFRYRSHLVAHMQIHTGDLAPKSERTCAVCSRQFRTPSGLRKHRRMHDADQRFKCTTCQKIFAFASVLREHERTHSNDCPYVCEVCGRSFKHSSNLFKHRRIHHEVKTLDVLLSGQTCERYCTPGECNCQLRRNESSVLSTRKRHQCEICKKYFASSSYLDMHSRVHTGERPFKCQICQNSFKQRSNLKKHMRLHDGDRPFSCRYCGKSFALNSNLRDHEKIHTGDRQFACATCEKRFITAAALRAHLVRHVDSTAESGVACTRSGCRQKFANDAELKLHIGRSHPMVITPSLMSHSCDVCHKTFNSMLALRRHSASHSSNRPHSCDACGKNFKYLSNLHSHRSSAHGHDPFTIGQLVRDLEFGADSAATVTTRDSREGRSERGPEDDCEADVTAELLEISEVTSYQLVCIAAGVPTLELIQ